jgi:hypothetical protein
MQMFDLGEAARRFEARSGESLDRAWHAALEMLETSVQSPVAMVSAFRRYRDTGRPPDGGRGQAVRVVAAATPEGVAWAKVPSETGIFGRKLTASAMGFDRYSGFDVVTFHAAEVLFEGGRDGDIGFGTERSFSGEYMRALEFTLACGELGYAGRSKATDIFTPTPDNVATARRSLGLPV